MTNVDEGKLPENICGECMEEIRDDFVFFITFVKDFEEFNINFCEPCAKNLMRGPTRG